MKHTATTVDIPARVRTAVSAALDKKALDPRVLHLGAVTDFTDYFVIVSGANERQVEAIADEILGRLRAAGVRPLGVEGVTQGQWALLDFGDFLLQGWSS